MQPEVVAGSGDATYGCITQNSSFYSPLVAKMRFLPAKTRFLPAKIRFLPAKIRFLPAAKLRIVPAGERNSDCTSFPSVTLNLRPPAHKNQLIERAYVLHVISEPAYDLHITRNVAKAVLNAIE